MALGIDGRGEALLFWENALPGQPGVRPEVVSKPLGSRWRPPLPLARPGNGELGEESIAVLPDGRAALVFERVGGVWLALRAADGRWRGARRVVAVHEGLFNQPQVLLEPDGSVVLAWTRGRSRNVQVQTLSIGAGGRRGRIGTVSALDGVVSELRLSGNGRGGTVLAWCRSRGKSGAVEASVMGSQKRFERPVRLATGKDSELTTAVDAGGEATVLFTHVLAVRNADQLPRGIDETPDSADVTAVELVAHPAGGGWDRPRGVPSPPGESTLHPSLAASDAGNRLLAAWVQAPFDQVEGYGWPAEAARDEASASNSPGAWEAPTQLSPPGSSSASIAVDADGDATAAWTAPKSLTEPEPSFENVEVAEYEPG